jgi:hypothetical protein
MPDDRVDEAWRSILAEYVNASELGRMTCGFANIHLRDRSGMPKLAVVSQDGDCLGKT